MQTIERILDIDLPHQQSAFLWGPRKTGKTTYLKSKFPQSLVFDFLQTDLFFEFSNFWRTKSGLEVDFVLGAGEVAIEVKGTDRVDKRDLVPLNAFIEEYSPRKALVVCNEREERVHGQIRIMPYKKFLHDLWQGKIISH